MHCFVISLHHWHPQGSLVFQILYLLHKVTPFKYLNSRSFFQDLKQCCHMSVPFDTVWPWVSQQTCCLKPRKTFFQAHEQKRIVFHANQIWYLVTLIFSYNLGHLFSFVCFPFPLLKVLWVLYFLYVANNFSPIMFSYK